MAPTLFISDLHLAPSRPQPVAALHALLRGPARNASALYILGDLFDAWIGDDQLREPLAAAVAGSIAELTGHGVPVYIQNGNRDFLLGEHFAKVCGAKLLPEAVVHDLHGTPTLLMHGDQLCTDDVEYQRFRKYWADPKRRRRALSRPYFVRRAVAAVLRFGSQRANARKTRAIMDVNADAVVAAMHEHGVTRMIHGHTHRPARHVVSIDGRAGERWVLSDWYGVGSYLEVSAEGVTPRVGW
jgi:UDP-2,3-diacylglucosamine hydrolase